MPRFDREFLKRCESLHRVARPTWGESFLGRRIERRLCGGVEVTDWHDYTAGDDFRYIDWYRCARHDELLTKEFRGSVDQNTYILIDCSASMGIGGRKKFVQAQRIAAMLGYLALANCDRVGGLFFSDQVIRTTPLLCGRKAAPDLIRFLVTHPDIEGQTSLGHAFEMLASHYRRPGLALILSDMTDPSGFVGPMEMLRRRGYQPFVVQIFDPEEANPSLQGRVRLKDCETDQTLGAALTPNDIQNYRDVYREFSDSVKQYCYRNRMGYQRCSTVDDYETTVHSMIKTVGYTRASG